jgi:hypothetical protein
VTTELFPSGRIGYFFKTQNNGPLLAVSADLVVIFSGVADPPTQAGWSFQGNSAKSSLGNVTAGSPPITSVITFRTNQKSDVIGFITSQTPDCEVGNGSAVSSYIPM